MKKYVYCLVHEENGILFSCYTLKTMDQYISDAIEGVFGTTRNGTSLVSDELVYDSRIEVMERGVLETIRLCDEMYGHKSIDRPDPKSSNIKITSVHGGSQNPLSQVCRFAAYLLEGVWGSVGANLSPKMSNWLSGRSLRVDP